MSAIDVVGKIRERALLGLDQDLDFEVTSDEVSSARSQVQQQAAQFSQQASAVLSADEVPDDAKQQVRAELEEFSAGVSAELQSLGEIAEAVQQAGGRLAYMDQDFYVKTSNASQEARTFLAVADLGTGNKDGVASSEETDALYANQLNALQAQIAQQVQVASMRAIQAAQHEPSEAQAKGKFDRLMSKIEEQARSAEAKATTQLTEVYRQALDCIK